MEVINKCGDEADEERTSPQRVDLGRKGREKLSTRRREAEVIHHESRRQWGPQRQHLDSAPEEEKHPDHRQGVEGDLELVLEEQLLGGGGGQEGGGGEDHLGEEVEQGRRSSTEKYR